MSEEQRPWPEPAWIIEAEQAEKQARAELRDRFAMAAKQARAELRDEFAKAALTGLLAAGSMWSGEAAAEAWRQADAMLKARGDE